MAIASATGVELAYKETLGQKDLENMLDTYFDKPEDFDDYALGDLEVYRILANNTELFKKVDRSLGVENYFKPPKLTIGSTVRDLFKATLYNKLGIEVSDREKQDIDIDHPEAKVYKAVKLQANAGTTFFQEEKYSSLFLMPYFYLVYRKVSYFDHF